MQPLCNPFIHFVVGAPAASVRSCSFPGYATYSRRQQEISVKELRLRAAAAERPAGADAAAKAPGPRLPPAHGAEAAAPARPASKAPRGAGAAPAEGDPASGPGGRGPGGGASRGQTPVHADRRASSPGGRSCAEALGAVARTPAAPLPAAESLDTEKAGSPEAQGPSEAKQPFKRVRGGAAAAGARFTTMMIRNMPFDIEQIDVVQELDDSGFKDEYDLVYMPSTFASGRGKGYAFVNFVSPAAAQKFVEVWHKTQRFGMSKSGTSLNVSAARIQGRDANSKKWDFPRMRRVKNPSYRPLIAVEPAAGSPKRLMPKPVEPAGAALALPPDDEPGGGTPRRPERPSGRCLPGGDPAGAGRAWARAALPRPGPRG
uniref:RRM domain-containing protein n=1 Tax=Alexandrium monilatum TaxID=311494 RepID=A0A7S4PVW0_9DINO